MPGRGSARGRRAPARGGVEGGSRRDGAGGARRRRERGSSSGSSHHGGGRSGWACGSSGGNVGAAPRRGGAAVAGLAEGQGAAGGQCGVALRHDQARFPAAQRAAAALRPPRAPGPRLPLQPVRSPGKLYQR